MIILYNKKQIMNEDSSADPNDYKNKRCTKCRKKAIYIIAYCDPIVKLCSQHAPQLSKGGCAYTELTVITKAPNCFGHEEIILDAPDMTRCYMCHRKIKNFSECIKYRFNNPTMQKMDCSTKTAIDSAIHMEEIEFWKCKNACERIQNKEDKKELKLLLKRFGDNLS